MEIIGLPILFSLIGIAFASLGFYLLFWNRKVEKNGIRTRAEIIDYSEGEMDFDDGKQIVFFPILKFTDKNGEVVTQKHDSGEHKKLDSRFIEIYYLKNDTEYDILINTSGWKTYFPVGLIIFGLIFIVFAVAIGIKNYSQQSL